MSVSLRWPLSSVQGKSSSYSEQRNTQDTHSLLHLYWVSCTVKAIYIPPTQITAKHRPIHILMPITTDTEVVSLCSENSQQKIININSQDMSSDSTVVYHILWSIYNFPRSNESIARLTMSYHSSSSSWSLSSCRLVLCVFCCAVLGTEANGISLRIVCQIWLQTQIVTIYLLSSSTAPSSSLDHKTRCR